MSHNLYNTFGVKGHIKTADGSIKQLVGDVYVKQGNPQPSLVKSAYINTQNGIKQIWPNAKVFQVGPEITTDRTWGVYEESSFVWSSVFSSSSTHPENHPGDQIQLGSPLESWLRTPFTWTRKWKRGITNNYAGIRTLLLQNHINISCAGLNIRYDHPLVADNTTGEPYFIRKGTSAYISKGSMVLGAAFGGGPNPGSISIVSPQNWIGVSQTNELDNEGAMIMRLLGPNTTLNRVPFFATSAAQAIQQNQKYYPGSIATSAPLPIAVWMGLTADGVAIGYGVELDQYKIAGTGTTIFPAGGGTYSGSGMLLIPRPVSRPESYTHLVQSPNQADNKNISTVPPEKNRSTKVTVFLYGKDDDAEKTFQFSQGDNRSRLECRQNSPNNKILKNQKYMGSWARVGHTPFLPMSASTRERINNGPLQATSPDHSNITVAYARVFGDAAYRQAWTAKKMCAQNDDTGPEVTQRELGMGLIPSDLTPVRPVGWFTNCNNQIGIVNNTEGMPRPISYSTLNNNFSSAKWSLGNGKNSTSWGGPNCGDIGWEVMSYLYIAPNGELRRNAVGRHAGIFSHDHTVFLNHHWHNDRAYLCPFDIDDSCMVAPADDPSILITTMAELNARINGPSDNKVYFVHPNANWHIPGGGQIDDDTSNEWHYLFNGLNEDIDSITFQFFQTYRQQDNYFSMPANHLRLIVEKVNPA